MNFWILVSLSLYGIPSIMTGFLLWKRNPVIIDSLKNQRITLVISLFVLPFLTFLHSDLYYSESYPRIWSLGVVLLLVGYLIWHVKKKEKIFSFYYYPLSEYIPLLENYLAETSLTLSAKPKGPFRFFRQYSSPAHKGLIQVEYNSVFSRFTLRFSPWMPPEWIEYFLRKMYAFAQTREIDKAPRACVIHLSVGIGWVILLIWMGFLANG